MKLNPLKREESTGAISRFNRGAFLVEIRALIALAIIVIFLA